MKPLCNTREDSPFLWTFSSVYPIFENHVTNGKATSSTWGTDGTHLYHSAFVAGTFRVNPNLDVSTWLLHYVSLWVTAEHLCIEICYFIMNYFHKVSSSIIIVSLYGFFKKIYVCSLIILSMNLISEKCTGCYIILKLKRGCYVS